MRIGVFDSGIGGLFLLKALNKKLAGLDFVYLADAENFPYGRLSLLELRSIVKANIQLLAQHKVDHVIIACNTASAVLEEQAAYPVPAAGIIEFALKQAKKLSRNLRVGLLATSATVKWKIYPQLAKKLGLSLNIYQQACPLLAPMIEQKQTDEKISLVLKKYLKPLMAQKVDTVIIGCTHYLYVKEKIKQITKGSVCLAGPEDLLIQYVQNIVLAEKTQAKIKTAGAYDKKCNISIIVKGNTAQYRKKCLSIIEDKYKKTSKVRFL